MDSKRFAMMDDEFAAGLRQYERTWGPLMITKISYAAGTIKYEYRLHGEPHVEEEAFEGDVRALAGQIGWWVDMFIVHLDERGEL